MAEQNFVDYVKINCRSGAGGNGSSHFHRDKTTSKGGPDGGDGGRGGHIILKGNAHVWTLLGFKFKKHVIAESGKHGDANQRTGASGKDVILEVPLGTIAKDAETGNVEFEITRHNETRILARGGRGGQGNAHYKTATKQAPEYSQTGEVGEDVWKILELKILADVGLVGFPNAGKSSLLAAITAAKPEIGDYPFTTLVPNLGIVSYRDQGSFIMADIPGIIENAHLGKGLGLRFLRHIERNAVLLFLVSIESEDINKEYEILLNELGQYNPDLIDKPRILAITKCDIVDQEWIELIKPTINVGIPYYFISSVAQTGLTELNDGLWKLLNEETNMTNL